MSFIDKFLNTLNKMKQASPIFHAIEKLEAYQQVTFIQDKEVEIKYKVEEIEPEKEKNIFEIIGHDNIKKILKSTVDSIFRHKRPVSILMDGSPGCGKSMFLKEIEKNFPPPQTYFVDGSRATKAGIFDVLFEDEFNKIKILLIDEIDKLDSQNQEALLTLMQDGRVVQTQKNGKRSKKYDNLSVIAASNDKDRMLEPLLTRFFDIQIKDYTDNEVLFITRKRLERYNLNQDVIEHIALKVLKSNKESKIRFAEQIAKLCNNDIKMVDMLIEHSK